MSFEREFEQLMATTVTVRARSSHDAYGKPTFAAASSAIPARVTQHPTAVRTSTNETQLSRTQLWLPPPAYTCANGTVVPIVTPDHEVIYAGTQHVILHLDFPQDETGIHHTVIYLA